MNGGQFRKYLYISLAGAVGVILCIVFFFMLFRFDKMLAFLGIVKSILMPFIYGAVIAYLLTPVCNFIENHLKVILKKKMKNQDRAGKLAGAAGITLSILSGVFVIYLLLAMVLPQVFTSIRGIVAVLPENVTKWSEWIQQRLEDNEVLGNYVNQLGGTLYINVENWLETKLAVLPENVTKWSEWIQQRLEDNEVLGNYVNQLGGTLYINVENWLETKLIPNMQTIVSGVSAGLIGALVVVKNILIGIIAAIYMMANRRRFAAQAKKILYSLFKIDRANDILEEVRFIDKMFGGFISGKLLDSLIIGFLCFFCMNLMNMPYTMLISVIVGVTNVIPFFGPYFGAVPSALIVLTVSPVKCIYFLLFILVLQQFDGNFLGPKILGNSTGLSSFWVLFSILLFGGLFGFVGMIIGVPAFAVIYDLIGKMANRLLRERNLTTDTGTYQELATVKRTEDGWMYVQNETEEEE